MRTPGTIPNQPMLPTLQPLLRLPQMVQGDRPAAYPSLGRPSRPRRTALATPRNESAVLQWMLMK